MWPSKTSPYKGCRTTGLHRFWSAWLFLLPLLWHGAATADIVIVGHPEFPVEQLSISEVRMLYLKKLPSLPDGSDYLFGDQPEGSPARQEFLAKVIRKDPAHLTAYWAKRIFSGKAIPPSVVGDDEEIIEWVLKTPNAIAYVRKGHYDRRLKALLVIE